MTREKIAYRKINTSDLDGLLTALTALKLHVPANTHVYVRLANKAQDYIGYATLFCDSLTDGSKVYEVELL